MSWTNTDENPRTEQSWIMLGWKRRKASWEIWNKPYGSVKILIMEWSRQCRHENCQWENTIKHITKIYPNQIITKKTNHLLVYLLYFFNAYSYPGSFHFNATNGIINQWNENCFYTFLKLKFIQNSTIDDKIQKRIKHQKVVLKYLKYPGLKTANMKN